ncbi:hypothetical protein AAGC94_04575 [Clostridium sporogenes]|uniref:hypothetical protein n=1 Tax=Clostridium TaxID=1485 RepID=UPI000DFE80D8|nr:hypothetical protein [Clostridium sporogenes]MCW6084240.1 hypothetical protein [Clostridium sporogenes]STC79744.1 Uncharacterised protein [Clostridium botulinum]
MTTLISWKGNDSRGIASIYLASDSRFSWKKFHWDYGQKVYGCANFPEIIGYCGDVLLAINIISSLIELIDNEIIYRNIISSDDKNRIVFEFIKEKFSLFPKNSDTTIVHIIKDSSNEFSYYEIKYNYKNSCWKNIKKNNIMEKESNLIEVYGSGKTFYRKNIVANSISDLYKTSRFYYMVLCNTLNEAKDKLTGGAPQVTGLYRGLNKSIKIGTIWNGERFLYGMKIKSDFNINKFEWRNINFERYKANENKLIEGAKKQPRPKNMKNHLDNKI